MNEMMGNDQEHKGNYSKFFAMIGTSMILMYILMYLNSYEILDHAWFSETRFFMTLIMGAVMTLVMFFFMRNMYKNNQINTAIVIGAVLVLVSAVWLVRSQVTVTAVQQTLARRRERRPLQQQRVEAGVERRDTLWALDDEITGLEKQERLRSSQLSQQRRAVALLAGEAWEQALELLRQPASKRSTATEPGGHAACVRHVTPTKKSHEGYPQPRAS
jgi:hypothetical protein